MQRLGQIHLTKEKWEKGETGREVIWSERVHQNAETGEDWQ